MAGRKNSRTIKAKQPFEMEIAAMQQVTSALSPLDPLARQRVLDYVMKALDVGLTTIHSANITMSNVDLPQSSAPIETPAGRGHFSDIRSLKDEKKPHSANEMSALVAYYLSEVAPSNERKETVGTEDIVKYFKQANFPLPQAIRNTLTNAAAAGYLDFVARGQYKLNPVGYNLVAHRLPGRATGELPKTRPKRKQVGKKR